MAKTQKEEAVVELTTEKPKIDETVDKLKIKKPKIKKFTQPDEVIKVGEFYKKLLEERS